MSVYGDERIDRLSQKIADELKRRGMLIKVMPQVVFGAEIRKAISEFTRVNEVVSSTVKKKIASLAKPPIEGSSAYNAQYERLFTEEWRKH